MKSELKKKAVQNPPRKTRKQLQAEVNELRQRLATANPETRKSLRAKAKAFHSMKELLKDAHECMQAFADPAGNMPQDTGEFLDLKRVMLLITPVVA